jgi:hypothetical protein
MPQGGKAQFEESEGDFDGLDLKVVAQVERQMGGVCLRWRRVKIENRALEPGSRTLLLWLRTEKE